MSLKSLWHRAKQNVKQATFWILLGEVEELRGQSFDGEFYYKTSVRRRGRLGFSYSQIFCWAYDPEETSLQNPLSQERTTHFTIPGEEGEVFSLEERIKHAVSGARRKARNENTPLPERNWRSDSMVTEAMDEELLSQREKGR